VAAAEFPQDPGPIEVGPAGNREVSQVVFRALLDAAGPTGSIQVAFRIFPEHVEVDVSRSDPQLVQRPGAGTDDRISALPARQPGGPAGGGDIRPAAIRLAQAAPARTAAGPWPADPVRPADRMRPADPSRPTDRVRPATVQLGQPGQPANFAEWITIALRREGMTQEAAARQLGVSVKTVSRWVGGTTEPRMRDLRRIQEVFGEVPLP
jgi:hypothetical protein